MSQDALIENVKTWLTIDNDIKTSESHQGKEPLKKN